jgi:hypothetical protein
MNAIIYHSNPHKRISGGLFYCFEYFVFLKKYCPTLRFIIVNADDELVSWIKFIFMDKYDFDIMHLSDIVPMSKPMSILREDIRNLIVLDTHTYLKIKDFTVKVSRVFAYSENKHPYVGAKSHHKFYGWYDHYQDFDIRERIKLHKDIHRVYRDKGNKIYVTALNVDINEVISILGLSPSEVYAKTPNQHNTNLFKNVNRMVYWHSGKLDTQNRSIVESCIHGIPLTVHLNGHTGDSIYDRHTMISNGEVDLLYLDENDKLIQDFLNDIQNT